MNSHMRTQLGLLANFWATVCKTVRPMLSDHCLFVTLAYCHGIVAKRLDGSTYMPLGTEVGLGPPHCAGYTP